MAWTSANTNTFSLFSNISQQQQQQKSHSTVNVVNITSSDEEIEYRDDDDDEEDMVVDLNSGSLEPQPLRGWNLLGEITQKMKKL